MLNALLETIGALAVLVSIGAQCRKLSSGTAPTDDAPHTD